MIKAVIFDCFGVFTEDGWLAFCQMYQTAESAEELRYLNHQMDKGLIDYETFLTGVCRLTGASREQAHQTITTNHHPNTELFAYAKKLKEAGYMLGMISNVGDELSRFLPESYLELFDAITLSYHVHAIKPSPEIYRHQLEQLHLPPEQCVFVDDREPNVVGARAVGMQGLHFVSTAQTIANLAALGIKVN